MGKFTITLDYILGFLNSAAQVAEVIPGAQAPIAAVADKFILIAQAAVKAHEAATGQPLDLALLKPVDPAV
jgi:hypothetical protein